MSQQITKEQREEALNKISEVLEQALSEMELLEKMDFELANDPTRAAAAPAPEASEEKPEDKKYEDKEDEKDDEEAQDQEGEDEKEESDDDLMRSYSALVAKMESRGLLEKSEDDKDEDKDEDKKDKKEDKDEKKDDKKKYDKKDEDKKDEKKENPFAKSETVVEDKTETLKKSFDERFESLSKAIEALSETVTKIAAQPAPRKSVSGLQPLKKNEEGSDKPNLNKSEAIDKLLDLRKTDKRITTELINRFETGRLMPDEIQFVQRILG